jgi:quercetin dioxygenase-like cupin family protein
MKKTNILSSPVKNVNTDYFTGQVKLYEISGITKPKEHDMYHVVFKKSARTKLHYHTGGQLLIVTKGNGSLILYNKKNRGISKFKISKIGTINLNIGDTVYIPAKTLHTHGSIKNNQTFSHIALNFYPKKCIKPQTIWFESDLRTIVTDKIH